MPDCRPESLNKRSNTRPRQCIFLNFAAAFELARKAVAYMRAHHGGGIVNVSSSAARKGMAHEYIEYAASKAAIETFTLG